VGAFVGGSSFNQGGFRSLQTAFHARPVMTALLALVVAWGGATWPARATELAQAEALYERGDLAQAATLARASGSAAGFSLAAKATLVQATYLSPKAEKAATFELAATDAKAALARDPNRVDAHLQLAIALGQLAELEDPLRAHVSGYANQGKALIDQALALDPGNAWARALLGIWHLRIVYRAGDALADSLYGASRATGVALCTNALATPDRALAPAYGCARALLDVDRDTFAGAAERTLQAVKDAPTADAADRLVQAEAGALLDQLKAAPAQ
jgi:hypothetical protein